jgi:hypothetical protein
MKSPVERVPRGREAVASPLGEPSFGSIGKSLSHRRASRAFSGKACPRERVRPKVGPMINSGGAGIRFSVRKCDNAKNAGAVSVSGLCVKLL